MILPVAVRAAPIHHIAAGDTLARGQGLGREFPFERRAGLAQIQRVHVVRVRGYDVHRVAGHDRRGFLSFVDTERESQNGLQRLDVVLGELRQR